MSIGRNVSDTISLANAQGLQCGRPTVAPIEKLGVREAQVFINNSFSILIKFASAAGKI